MKRARREKEERLPRYMPHPATPRTATHIAGIARDLYLSEKMAATIVTIFEFCESQSIKKHIALTEEAASVRSHAEQLRVIRAIAELINNGRQEVG